MRHSLNFEQLENWRKARKSHQEKTVPVHMHFKMIRYLSFLFTDSSIQNNTS